jgi:NAD(P)-dependent dehydrogenase (short-subunit alcohol dehydrogenase family)
MVSWTDDDVPDQAGRTAVVTGATNGLGLRVAEVLASKGARVVLTSRDPERGARALKRVQDASRDEGPELVMLDLASLRSVRAAASAIRHRINDRLDIVINNAGVMAPTFGYSANGIELQWATNVLGPAALTRLLLPAVRDVPGSRIVGVSSISHFAGRFDAERLDADVAGEQYNPFAYYSRTKLAALLYARELERHLRTTHAQTVSLAAHPGWTLTGIGANADYGSTLAHRVMTGITALVAQPVEAGARPLLYAVTAPGVRGGQYFGPNGIGELRGWPARAARSPSARSDELGRILLRSIDELTGVARPAWRD